LNGTFDVPARLVKAEQLQRKARLINIIGFTLVLAAAVAMAIGLVWSRIADMWVLHTLECNRPLRLCLSPPGTPKALYAVFF